MPEESSPERSRSPSRFSKSMFIAPKAFVRKSLSPVDHIYHSVADLRFSSSNSETLESTLQAINKKMDSIDVSGGAVTGGGGGNEVSDDVAQPQCMAKSFAGFLATASMYAGMDELREEEEESNSSDEVELLNDAATTILDASSQADRTLFDFSIEMNQDALSQPSTASKSRKDLVREKLLKKFIPDEDEHYVEEFPCWLLRDIMIQGHIYLTNKHLFFFAFIPNFENDFHLSGSLQFVSGPSLGKSHRYWVVLKGRTLTFHGSSTDLYFPLLAIDIKDIQYAKISAREAHYAKFEIKVKNDVIELRADSFHSARHWVSSIKKQIFASQHSDTNTITVKIPLQNIVDLDENAILDQSGTLRIKALENTSGYAIDEYFFVFFQGSARKMKNKINSLLKDLELSGSQILIDFKKVESATDLSNSGKNADSKKNSSDLLVDSVEDAGSVMDNDMAASTAPLSAPISELPTSDTGHVSSAYPKRVKKRIKSMASSLRLTSPNKLERLEDDIIIEHYSPGIIHDPSVEVEVEPDKDSKSIISRLTPKKFQNIPTMWAADPVHFNVKNDAFFPLDDKYAADVNDSEHSDKRFKFHFSFDNTVTLLASYHGYLNRNMPVYGKIYISDKNICFRSLLPGVNTKMVLPLEDIENCSKETGFRFGYFGLVIVIQGHEELFLEFSNKNARDDCEFVLMKTMDINGHTNTERKKNARLDSIHKISEAANLKLLEEKISEQGYDIPLIVEKNPYFTTTIKPNKSYKFGLLTIGSRGDVQPYIALAKGLMAEGHTVVLLTHLEFKDWIESYGIEFREISGNPAELISLMVQHGSMNVGLLRDASANFTGWIGSLLQSAWEGAQGIDILIESPSAMAGIHIAEALEIPYFRAFTMPWTRTRAYPHAFIVPDQKRGGSYNYFTHVLFENIFWKGISGKVNEWREKTLNLPKTNLFTMQQNRVPFLYNVSPTIYPPSIDFNEWIKVTGYWFLDEKLSYDPPPAFVSFLKKARELKKKIVYIGFGSIVVNDPQKMTDTIVDAVLEADVFCVLNKGWSNRFGDKDAKAIDKELPACIYNSGDVPHDWLFTQIDASVHHGGSGTTGASLRAGLPTIIKPFFGDQFFYASRIEDIGAGVALKKLNKTSLAKALTEVTTNTRIIRRAKHIGELISKEHGVETAISCIYSELGYARSLIKKKSETSSYENLASTEDFSTDHSDSDARRIPTEQEELSEPSTEESGASNDGSWLLV